MEKYSTLPQKCAQGEGKRGMSMNGHAEDAGQHSENWTEPSAPDARAKLIESITCPGEDGWQAEECGAEKQRLTNMQDC